MPQEKVDIFMWGLIRPIWNCRNLNILPTPSVICTGKIAGVYAENEALEMIPSRIY